jgi:hypothetical protein
MDYGRIMATSFSPFSMLKIRTTNLSLQWSPVLKLGILDLVFILGLYLSRLRKCEEVVMEPWALPFSYSMKACAYENLWITQIYK